MTYGDASAPRCGEPAPHVAVGFEGDATVCARATELARTLSLPWLPDANSTDYPFQLVLTAERLELRQAPPTGKPRHTRMRPIHVDYTAFDLRAHAPTRSRRQPLARAFGKKTRRIADATAGYGRDALLLALLGFCVTAIERVPAVAALAQDGLRRLREGHPVAPGRLSYVCGEARQVLPSLDPPPDAIYLDPMFPPKRRASAAVAKEMRVLRALVGEDADASALLALSRTIARDRVVVKRPDDAQPLAPDPDISHTGKLVRYDVYLTGR